MFLASSFVSFRYIWFRIYLQLANPAEEIVVFLELGKDAVLLK